MNQHKRILLLGASGKVGKYFWKRLKNTGAIGTYGSHAVPGGVHFDIVTDSAVTFMKRYRDDISHAILLLGITEPDACARDKIYTNQVNLICTKKLIDALIASKINVTFISSEFVFDGKKGNYKETDVPHPVLTYGKQKLEIEQYLSHKTDTYLIARFGKVYGDISGDGTLFTSWVEKLLKGEDISVANDQVFSPIWAEDLVTAVLGLIENEAHGIYHVAGPRALSRKELFEITVKNITRIKKIRPHVTYKSIDDFELVEKRPHNVSLAIGKLTSTTGFTPNDPEKICGRIVKNYSL